MLAWSVTDQGNAGCFTHFPSLAGGELGRVVLSMGALKGNWLGASWAHMALLPYCTSLLLKRMELGEDPTWTRAPLVTLGFQNITSQEVPSWPGSPGQDGWWWFCTLTRPVPLLDKWPWCKFYCLCHTCPCWQSPDMALVVGSHSHCFFSPSPDGCSLHLSHLYWITKPQAFLVPSSGLVSASLSLWSVAPLYQGICPADSCPHGPSSPVYTPRQQEAMGYHMWVLEDHFPCRYSTETSRNLRYGVKPLSGPKPATPPWGLQGLLASPRTWSSISLVALLGCRFCLFPFDLEVCPRQGNLQFNCFDLNKFLFEM